MPLRTREYALAISLALGCMIVPTRAQLPPPPPPPATLWSFLGIPQAYRSFRDNLNARGNRPGLERKPPMKAIADPKNLASDNPAIKKAAEVKIQEDLKPQKIKAIKYLASIGCGCYNRDGSITDALIKAMDDCSEEVRLATVWAISEAAAGEACANCKQRSCCSEEISNKLYEIAYERDETGCFLEPSERVRLAAAEALRTCCPGGDENFIIETAPPPPATGGEQPGVVPETGGERPGVVPPPAPMVPTPVPAPIVPPAAAPPPPAPAVSPNGVPRSSRRTAAAPKVPQRPEVTEKIVRVQPLRLDPPPATPHWTPGKVQQSVYFVPPARGPLPIIDAPIPSSATTAEPVRVAGAVGISPLVKNATLTRLPPVDVANVEPIPGPPLPPVTKQATPVSTHRLPLQSVIKGSDASNASGSDPATPVNSTEASKRTRSDIPVSQRTLPGAQYGTGMVTSVRLKEGMAMLEFANDAPIPPGSVLRAYHEYALTGKTAVCDLEVIRGESGKTAAVARAGSELTALSVGDRAIVLR